MAEGLDLDEGFGVDEDDAEPLFADDLDDPPPLPPPMPSLSQLHSSHHHTVSYRTGLGWGGAPLIALLHVVPYTSVWRCWWSTSSSSGWQSGTTSEEEEALAHIDH